MRGGMMELKEQIAKIIALNKDLCVWDSWEGVKPEAKEVFIKLAQQIANLYPEVDENNLLRDEAIWKCCDEYCDEESGGEWDEGITGLGKLVAKTQLQADEIRHQKDILYYEERLQVTNELLNAHETYIKELEQQLDVLCEACDSGAKLMDKELKEQHQNELAKEHLAGWDEAENYYKEQHQKELQYKEIELQMCEEANADYQEDCVDLAKQLVEAENALDYYRDKE